MSVSKQYSLGCIATSCLSGTLPEKLEAASNNSFDGVELCESDLLSYNGKPEDIRKIAEDLELAIMLYQPFCDFEGMPAAHLARNLDRAEHKFDIMQSLGTDMLLVVSNVQVGAMNDKERVVGDLCKLAERAAKRGLRVGYEALPWARHVTRWRQAWHIVNQVNHPAFGLVVNSLYTLAIREDFSAISRLPPDKIFFVQLADAPHLRMDVLTLSRHYGKFPGLGDLPVIDFLRAVLTTGYCGPLSLGVSNDEYSIAQPEHTARLGLSSLILTEQEVRHSKLFTQPRFNGLEFVEFAVDGNTEPSLAAFLQNIGFCRIGRHKSKDVDLYRYGEINFILNKQKDCAASEYFQLHGPSVCAIAFKIDDVSRAIDRAIECLVVPQIGPRGINERELSAILAPDGTLVYLIEASPTHRSRLEDDFEIISQSNTVSSLKSIDHLSFALSLNKMDEMVLLYKVLFGFSSEYLGDLSDPHGQLHSRAMTSHDHTIRMTLNASEGHDTLVGRFVSASHGSGVLHIAFATDQIETAIFEMSSRGMQMLQIPRNYYESLSDQYGLDSGRIEELRRLNILYDCNEDGEFMSAFTVPYNDRIFFEIVQRGGRYQKYGSTTAAVTLAALARLHESV